MGKNVKERDIMKTFMKRHLKHDNFEGYWLRLEDGVFGNFKPADGVLFTYPLDIMIEFKVERRVTYAFTLRDLREHQRMSLLKFEGGRRRASAVLVYHVREDRWHLYRTKKHDVISDIFSYVPEIHVIERW